MANSFNLSFDPAPLLKQVQSVREAVEASTRGAARAGAVVLRDEARRRAANTPQAAKWGVSQTGNFSRAIYHQFAHDRSIPDRKASPGYMRAIYAVSWNHAKAPHAWNVENGHWQYFRWTRDAGGNFWTMRQPHAWGKAKPRPPRKKTGDRTDQYNYWVPLDKPKWIQGYPIIRPTFAAMWNQALQAVNRRFNERLAEELAERGL
ncbi:hypothetical protein [Azohydromonas aeria]|uniref:hypothetical protein n=1 Tax=Azohydromonas aeria TaxID=2590212 RepID=UPI0012F96B25|nr:hypothetical protein [Azohydromonas aeria]